MDASPAAGVCAEPLLVSGPACKQEHKGALKVVKVEHDPNPALVARYKVSGLQIQTRGAAAHLQQAAAGDQPTRHATPS